MFFLETIRNIDHLLFQTINQLAFRRDWFDMLGVFLANYFIYFVAAFLLLFLLRFRKNWKMVLEALLSAIIARFVIVDFIRWIYPRQRPFNGENINLLINKVNELSFPSGHAAFSFGLATIVFLYNKKIGTLFLIFAILISIARIFVGVHWPLDILTGALVGIFSGLLINIISKKLKT